MSSGKGRALLAAPALALLVFALVPEAPPAATGGWIAAQGLAARFETVEGLRVRYVRAGSGPPVVLIHGLSSSIYTWREVLPALAQAHDVVALDLPGFGGSDQPPDLTADAYLPVVVELMDRLGISRASLVGHSLGGAVSVLVAARHPERVHRLVLIDAAGYNLAPSDRPWLVRLSQALGPLLDPFPIRRLMVRTGLRQNFHDDALVTDSRVEEYVAPLLRPGALRSVRSMLSSRGSGAFGAFPAVVGEVRAATLIVWGRQDEWIPVDHAGRFAAAIPGSRVSILEGCGHLPQEEKPAVVAPLLLEFLGQP